MLRTRLIQRVFSRGVQTYIHNPQIFVHEAGDKFSYSISENPKALIMGSKTGGSPHTVDPEKFSPNPEFIKLLNSTISKDIVNDFSFIMEAGANVDSFMPIWDFREVPRFSRTPDVDSIFGYIMVDKNGKMIPGTYEANNMYRVCNSAGLPKMTDHIHAIMKEEVEKTFQS
ncbi:hypothetical protein DICA1_E18800 [Diutina catenulata]